MSQFDDKTFENLQNEMLDEANSDTDRQEGSLLATSIALQAMRLEEAYADMDSIYDNMFVDTMDREHLIESGAEAGVPINAGTPAVVVARVNCECEEGTEFSATDSEYNYVLTESAGTQTVDGETYYLYHLESEDDGVEPGIYRGYIEPLDEVDGFEEAQIIALYSAGKDEEDTEAYRERRLSWYNEKACAGNRAYYKEAISGIEGVTGVKLKRREAGEETITAIITGADYGLASDELITSVKAQIDPTETTGEGYGLAPIGHKVTVKSASSVDIAVTASIVLKPGYKLEDAQASAETAVKAYLESAASTWQDSTEMTIRLSRIEVAVIQCEEIEDITGVTINGGSSNVKLSEYQVPHYKSVALKEVS